jgi:hypothetical protein
MNETLDTAAAIESLRSFAIACCEIEFAHLCTAALNGEQWAAERVRDALDRIGNAAEYGDAAHAVMLASVCSTDTTRPDGAIARSFQV